MTDAKKPSNIIEAREMLEGGELSPEDMLRTTLVVAEEVKRLTEHLASEELFELNHNFWVRPRRLESVTLTSRPGAPAAGSEPEKPEKFAVLVRMAAGAPGQTEEWGWHLDSRGEAVDLLRWIVRRYHSWLLGDGDTGAAATEANSVPRAAAKKDEPA